MREWPVTELDHQYTNMMTRLEEYHLDPGQTVSVVIDKVLFWCWTLDWALTRMRQLTSAGKQVRVWNPTIGAYVYPEVQ